MIPEQINFDEIWDLQEQLMHLSLKMKVLAAKKGYKMCESQPVQLDCRMVDCAFHKHGNCTHAAPAVTLNESSKFVCWTHIKSL